MKNKFISIAKLLIGWPLTLIAFFFLLKLITPNFGMVLSSLHNLNYVFLILGILSYFGYFFFRSIFWQRLMQAKGHHLSLRETAYLWEGSEFKRYIPGNILAFVTRTSHFAGKEVKKTTVFSSLLIEVEFIILGSIVISLLSLNFIIYGLLPGFAYKHWVLGGVTILSLFVIFLVLGNQYLLKHVFARSEERKTRQSPNDARQTKHETIAEPVPELVRKNVPFVNTILPKFSFPN